MKKAARIICILLAGSWVGFIPRSLAVDAGAAAAKGGVPGSLEVAPSLAVDLFASEPNVVHPIALSVDPFGRVFVAEDFRFGNGFAVEEGALDIRARMSWLSEDLRSKSLEDRERLIRSRMGTNAAKLTRFSDRVRWLERNLGNGLSAHLLTGDLTNLLHGLAADVFATRAGVYWANLPGIYFFPKPVAGKTSPPRQLLYGFGVHVGYLGHDLHGFQLGPDGKLYFSMGDRGLNVTSQEGRKIVVTDTGAVLRCNPDGSDLELFATGLRNPQKLTFDEFGNLFTGDNNADFGDPARWVYVVEGGDSGWRLGYQHLKSPIPLGPWNDERLWEVGSNNRAAYIVPPVSHVGQGPSGVAYYPGSGWSDEWNGTFFLCDFMGSQGGVWGFKLRPQGASFTMETPTKVFWKVAATDMQFGWDGAYVSDWVGGLDKSGLGRIYRLTSRSVPVVNSGELATIDPAGLSNAELATRMNHPDMRIRQEAQFELAGRGKKSLETFRSVLGGTNRLARVHAVWGLGQVGRKHPQLVARLIATCLSDPDAEVRAQAAKVTGEAPLRELLPRVTRLLHDPAPRVRFFAALTVGKLGHRPAFSDIVTLLQENQENDPTLRHAGVMALVGIGETDRIVALRRHGSESVRVAATVALRRLKDSRIALFLDDPSVNVVREAARAIHDVPIAKALPALARLESNRSDPDIGRRVVNANASLADEPAGERLLAIGINKDSISPTLRLEALGLLAAWEKPGFQNRVTGAWQENHRMPAPGVRPLLVASLAAMLSETAPGIPLTAIQIAQNWKLHDSIEPLRAFVQSKTAAQPDRQAALKALSEIDPAAGCSIAIGLLKAPGGDLKAPSIQVLAEHDPGRLLGAIDSLLQLRNTAEMQALAQAAGTLPGAAGSGVLARLKAGWMKGTLPDDILLELCEAGAETDPAFAALVRKKGGDTLGMFAASLSGGIPQKGKEIFDTKVEASCIRCHRVNGTGGEVGPDLTHVARGRTAEYLLDSMLHPNNTIAPGFESVNLTLRDGSTVSGILKKQTDESLSILGGENELLTVKRSEIVRTEKGLSSMPEGLEKLLSRRELRDLVAYLKNLQ